MKQKKCRDCGKIIRINPPVRDLPNIDPWSYQCGCKANKKLADYGKAKKP